MGRRVLAAAAAVALGAALVALPDDDDRVISLSGAHGPSAIDLVGVAVLVAGWAPVPLVLYRDRRQVPGWAWQVAAALGVVAAAALVVAVSRDLGWWWLPAAAALCAAQVLPLLVARRTRSAAGRRGDRVRWP